MSNKLSHYSYGDCHVLAFALKKHMGWDILCLTGQESGMICHYCNQSPKRMSFIIDGQGERDESIMIQEYENHMYDVSEMEEEVDLLHIDYVEDISEQPSDEDMQIAFDLFKQEYPELI